MLSYIIKLYKQISQSTYYNFDIYHLHALNNLLGEQYSARDLQLLSFIGRPDHKVTPTLIKETFHIQHSTISNRLAFFEQQHLINRSRSQDDLRAVEIVLSEEGKTLMKVYSEYMNEFVQSVRKSLSISETITIIPTLKKLAKLVQSEADIDASKTDKIQLDNTFLIQILNYFNNVEISFLSENHLSMKQRDLFILCEIFISTHSEPKTKLTQLANHLMIPYQSLITKMRKYEEMNYFTRHRSDIVFDAATIKILREYMMLRTITYYETMDHFLPKEQQIILKLFATLKLHALNSSKNETSSA